jgi:hypothetical protein
MNLPDDFPNALRHSDADTPVPTWAQVTRSISAVNQPMIAQVARLVADTDDEPTAHAVWESWPGNYRRSTALIIDKVYAQGWLDALGAIDGWPWDGGFYCRPAETARGAFADVLDSLSGGDRPFIACTLRNGLLAYLNAYSHKAWRRGWMETDTATAALHVGLMKDGRAEIHFDVFNPLFISGAPRGDLIRIPLVGSFNRRQFMLHRRWEQSEFAPHSRTSANLYHLMHRSVPLSF